MLRLGGTAFVCCRLRRAHTKWRSSASDGRWLLLRMTAGGAAIIHRSTRKGLNAWIAYSASWREYMRKLRRGWSCFMFVLKRKFWNGYVAHAIACRREDYLMRRAIKALMNRLVTRGFRGLGVQCEQRKVRRKPTRVAACHLPHFNELTSALHYVCLRGACLALREKHGVCPSRSPSGNAKDLASLGSNGAPSPSATLRL